MADHLPEILVKIIKFMYFGKLPAFYDLINHGTILHLCQTVQTITIPVIFLLKIQHLF